MVNCPVCKMPLPHFRIPTTMNQFFWGGWTCGYCKSRINRKGELIEKNEAGLKEYEEKLFNEEYIKEKARLKARQEQKKKEIKKVTH